MVDLNELINVMDSYGTYFIDRCTGNISNKYDDTNTERYIKIPTIDNFILEKAFVEKIKNNKLNQLAIENPFKFEEKFLRFIKDRFL